MALCFYNGQSNRGNEWWGDWLIRRNVNVKDNIVKYCRRAFKKQYKGMWINPIYFDDKYFGYSEEFFSEVGIELYPKLTDPLKELNKRGFNVPKTRDEWRRYKNFIWEIVQKDIQKNINKGVKPICVVVNGVHFCKNGQFYDKIISVQQVDKLKENC